MQTGAGGCPSDGGGQRAVLESPAATGWTSQVTSWGRVHAIPLPEDGPRPIPLRSEADPCGQRQRLSGGKVGAKAPRASNVLSPHGQARHAGPPAVSKPAAQPGILALIPST